MLDGFVFLCSNHTFDPWTLVVLIPDNEDNCDALSYPWPKGTYAYVDSHTGYADRVFSVPARQNYTLCAREDGVFVHHKHITFEAHYQVSLLCSYA